MLCANGKQGAAMVERKVEVAVIGAGTAGMGAFRAAGRLTDSVLLIEGDRYGTTCARVGCMPSKLLIAAAEAAHMVREAPGFGIETAPPRVNGKAVMDRVRRERDRFVGFVIETVEEWPENQRLMGRARFVDDHTLEVGRPDGEVVRIEAGRIVIATGSSTVYPGFFKAAGDRLVTSDDVFDWTDLPESVAVFGGGVIGLELGQALARLGVRLRLFGKGGGVGPLSDPDVVAAATAALACDFPFHPDAEVHGIDRDSDQVVVTFTDPAAERTTERFDYLLAATGRRPDLAGLGLENTSLALDDKGVPRFDPCTLQCGDSHVFIAGDVNAFRPLLHEAADEGRTAGENAARHPEVRAGLRRVPMGVVFTDPGIAVVGEGLKALEARECPVAIGSVDFEGQGRSRVMRQNRGLLRVYGEQGSGQFLGAEMAAPRAEHLAHLLAWCLQQRLTVPAMLDMPFYHPVIEEGLRTALRDLNRNLRLGPAPVKRSMDCGPGA
jgi:dihydrolipoamide dehydrogenase